MKRRGIWLSIRVVSIVAVASAGCGRSADMSGVDGGGGGGGDPPKTQRFAAFGDYGLASPDEAAVAKLVKGQRPDFILTLGDNNYPAGETATIDDNIGQYYSDYIGGYTGHYGIGSATNRFWPALGNHDRYSMPPLKPYLDYFHVLPGNQRNYQVKIGRVELFAVESGIDGEMAPNPGGWGPMSKQAEWLRDALAASTACFKVVYFHHPPISSGTYAVATMNWTFAAWGADVVLAGHEHFYERLDLDGIPLLIAGLGGNDRFGFMGTPHPKSQFRFNTEYGALFGTVDDNGLTFEFLTTSQVIIDRITLPKMCAD